MDTVSWYPGWNCGCRGHGTQGTRHRDTGAPDILAEIYSGSTADPRQLHILRPPQHRLSLLRPRGSLTGPAFLSHLLPSCVSQKKSRLFHSCLFLGVHHSASTRGPGTLKVRCRTPQACQCPRLQLELCFLSGDKAGGRKCVCGESGFLQGLHRLYCHPQPGGQALRKTLIPAWLTSCLQRSQKLQPALAPCLLPCGDS